MKTIAGRAVCETLEELTDPHSTALLLVDLQNDFVADDGVVAGRGEGREVELRGVLANTLAVLQAARARGVVVAYLRYARTADHRHESPASLRWTVIKRGYEVGAVSAVEGTWGAEIAAPLAPAPGELVIDKRRASGFFGTALDEELRSRNVRTVILAGVSTHGCVEATARDAELRDYYVVVLEDCVGAYRNDLHASALTVMRSRYDVVPGRAVIETWSRLEGRPSYVPSRDTC